MKIKSLITVAALTAVGLTGSAVAQTAESNVVGYYTLTLNQGFNLVGVQLHNNPLATGTFETSSGATLFDAEANFAALSSLAATQTLLVEIETGAQAGAVAEISSVGTTDITLTGAVPAAGASYTIRRSSTLNELFGDVAVGNSFLSGAEDFIWLPDGAGGFTTYALNTTGNEFRPTANFFTPVTKPVSVFYPDGAFFEKKAAGSLNTVVAGDLKTGGTVLAANEGFNLVASPGPEGVTFGEANLDPPFLQGGSFLSGAEDFVWLPDGSGGFDTYAFNTTGSQWRPTANFFAGDATNTELTSGFFIERKVGNGDTAGKADVPTYYGGL